MRKLWASVLVCALSAQAAAPQKGAYTVSGSTRTATISATAPSVKKKRASAHRLRRVTQRIGAVVPRRIKEAPERFQRSLRATSPNPKIQGPSAQAMPPQAPAMPEPPKETPQPPNSGADRFLNQVAKVMTKSWKGNIFVWLPAISTDPNTGPTIGLMPVLVLAEPTSHRIQQLLAPSYTYNDLFGQTGTMRYYYYPTETSQLYANASMSQHTNREFKVRYENPGLNDGVFYLRSEVYYSANGSERFFGLGPATHEGDESGYVSKDSTVRLTLGANFFRYWRATVGGRFRRYATEQNIIPETVDTGTRFPSAPGLGTMNTVSNEFRLLWDTRDTPVTPSRGQSGEFFVEKTSLALGSDSDYIRYGAEGKHFLLWKDPKQITVLHGLYEWANGPFIPFYELPNLGGRESLRGFGERRFVDRGRMLFSVEHRYTFSSLSLMGIQTNFEVAPFVDLGTVFPTVDQVQRKYFRPVYGAAFRAAVKPNVVGDVEIGYGKEGTAVYVDINYPF